MKTTIEMFKESIESIPSDVSHYDVFSSCAKATMSNPDANARHAGYRRAWASMEAAKMAKFNPQFRGEMRQRFNLFYAAARQRFAALPVR